MIVSGKTDQDKAKTMITTLVWAGLGVWLLGVSIGTSGSESAYYFGLLLSGLGGCAAVVGLIAYAVTLAIRATRA